MPAFTTGNRNVPAASVTAVASWMPCGIVVHELSPLGVSEQKVLNSSDLYFTRTPSPTGVWSGFRILPATSLVGCSLSVRSSVDVGSGIIASSAIGSGLNWPAARTVNAPDHRPFIAKAPVLKSVSTIRKFWMYWKSTPTRPPATTTWSPEMATRALIGVLLASTTTPLTPPPLPPRNFRSALTVCLLNLTVTFARLPSLKSALNAVSR